MKPWHLALSLALLYSICLSAAEHPANVITNLGEIEGNYAQSSATYEFKGIPYAKPPVGDLRWKAPIKIAPWQGVKQAKQFAPRPMQLPIFGDMNFRSNDMSEDSLYLNVWTNDLSPTEKQPVLVYFYGGGFIAGDSSEPRYDGTSMAQNGIVTVTVNYRLGIFGFFAHPQLSAETAYKGSGNYGLLDQAAALAWVKDNISAFGGDPQRITIGGESAGSISVSALMVSPLSKDLFAGAIGESGSIIGSVLAAKPLALAEKSGAELAKAIGHESLASLRQLSAEELLNTTSKNNFIWFGPTTDNYFFPDSPINLFRQGKHAKVPLLAGVNSEEASYSQVLADQEPTVDNYKLALQKLYPKHHEAIFKLYPASDTNSVLDAAQDLASDRFLSYSTWLWADLVNKNNNKNPVFYYLYAHPRPPLKATLEDMQPGLAGGLVKKTADSPQPLIRGAVHSAEIEYALGNLATNQVFAWQEEDYAISKNFQQYLIQFIKTANPNGGNLPNWPLFSSHKRVIIDKEISQGAMELLEKRYALLSEINQN